MSIMEEITGWKPFRDGLDEAVIINSAQSNNTNGIRRDMKNLAQDIEAIAKTAQDKAEGKTTLETWNKAKIKARDVVDSL